VWVVLGFIVLVLLVTEVGRMAVKVKSMQIKQELIAKKNAAGKEE